MLVNFFYTTPTWLVGLVVVGVWTGVSLAGLWAFNLVSDSHKREKDTETVGLTYAIVAVVYAVLIGFIVVNVFETFSKGDEIATAEVNKLTGIMLSTAGLPETEGVAVLADLKHYLDIVIKKEWPSQQAGKVEAAEFEAGWHVLAHLNKRIAGFEPKTAGQSVNKGEMLRSMNELSKARRSRILAAGEHLADVVWQILLVAGAVAVAYTYLFGAHSFGIHLSITGFIAATISLVFTLIIALDYPFRGDVSVGDEGFVSLSESLNAPGEAKEKATEEHGAAKPAEGHAAKPAEGHGEAKPAEGHGAAH